jgi:hypothetical protein
MTNTCLLLIVRFVGLNTVYLICCMECGLLKIAK